MRLMISIASFVVAGGLAWFLSGRLAIGMIVGSGATVIVNVWWPIGPVEDLPRDSHMVDVDGVPIVFPVRNWHEWGDDGDGDGGGGFFDGGDFGGD